MLVLPALYPLILSASLLGICCVSDLKCRQIYPFICAFFAVLSLLDPGKNYTESFIGALFGFLPLFLSAIFGNGGGGDALLACAIGFILPFVFSAYTFLAGSFLYILALSIYVLKTGRKKARLPYAPFLFFGWALVLTAALFLDGGTAL